MPTFFAVPVLRELRHCYRERTNGWMDGWVDGWMDGWVDGWIDGWKDGSIDGLTKHK